MRKPPGLHVIMKLRREERRRLDAEANRAARDNETEEEREERRRLDLRKPPGLHVKLKLRRRGRRGRRGEG